MNPFAGWHHIVGILLASLLGFTFGMVVVIIILPLLNLP